MAGKFTDTKYTKTIDSLVTSVKERIQNPYYKFSDKKPTKVVYYRQNTEKTTSDEVSEEIYQHIGDRSPVKFNKILDFYIYGFSRIETNASVGEYGLESDDIVGTIIVLPNTIVPMQGDFFLVPYLKEKALFKVNSVNQDTLYDGANVYQVEYKLETFESLESIEKQVVKTYHFTIQNVGTDFSPLLEDSNYQLIEKLDAVLENMTSLYQLFFDKNVQNFVYNFNGFYMYDPYLIEFIIRNRLMNYGNDYIYVSHGTPLPKTFGYDYSRSLFAIIEEPSELEKREIVNSATASEIQDINTLFTTRLHSYYKVEYFHGNPYMQTFNILPYEVIEHIKTGKYFEDKNMIPYNLLIAYFNSDSSYISDKLIDVLKYTDYAESKEFYYLIPIDIFIINHFIESLMK